MALMVVVIQCTVVKQRRINESHNLGITQTCAENRLVSLGASTLAGPGYAIAPLRAQDCESYQPRLDVRKKTNRTLTPSA
jgi:hypothetical protein